MNIYLKINEKTKIDVFDLTISQEEDHFATATLIISAKETLPPCGTEGMIEGDRPYFKGIMGGMPAKIEGECAEICLIARPSDLRPYLEALRKESSLHPYWNPLWVKDPQNLEEIQDVHPSSLYWDRRHEGLIRSDWFEGRSLLDVGENFFSDSLSIRLKKPPFTACKVQVRARWIQKEEGVENLGFAIKNIFPTGQVSTYTKEALTKKWPQEGHQLGRTGLWILKSKLEEITPTSPLYPLYSPAVRFKETQGTLKSYRAKRHWFKPTLWVRWRRHQKRSETLSFTLAHNVQDLFPQKGDVATYDVTLQNINPPPKDYLWSPRAFYKRGTKVCYENARYTCRETHRSGLHFEEDKWAFYKPFHTPLGHSARASFFLTSQGHKAAEHAMERAKAMLAKSARAVEVSFEAPWETIQDITTDTTVLLKDPRLPQGKARGKVVSYHLIARGDTGERFGRVTLVCGIGSRRPPSRPSSPLRGPCYVEGGYGDEDSSVQKTPSGVSYFSYDDQLPPVLSQGGNLLKKLTLTHGPDDQEKALRGCQGYAKSHALQLLNSLSTRLCLYFKDLRTKETLEHTISVTMAAPWSAPCQWDASQET